jgi:hypothetical protein
MKVERQVLHYCFDQARSNIKLGNSNEARDCADRGIAYIASKRSEGVDAKDKIEGVRVELWLERFWMFLENNNLLLA